MVALGIIGLAIHEHDGPPGSECYGANAIQEASLGLWHCTDARQETPYIRDNNRNYAEELDWGVQVGKRGMWHVDCC